MSETGFEPAPLICRTDIEPMSRPGAKLSYKLVIYREFFFPIVKYT